MKKLELVVSSVRAEACDVMSVELRDATGQALPSFEPGAHIDIDIRASSPEGVLTRQYSLCNGNDESDRYVVAVGRAATSRGGSSGIHNHVRVGTRLTVSLPRNNFPLVKDAERYFFIAGGIGITPILSMILWCEKNKKNWSLLYCTRNRSRCAFYEVLAKFGDRVRFHFDDERGGPVDLAEVLDPPPPGTHLYCCGPTPLMKAVEERSSIWPPAAVHFEWFSAPTETTSHQVTHGEFDVVLARKGCRVKVAASQSILEALEANGIDVPFSCRAGICRACETTVLAGSIDHRDFVLSKAEQAIGKNIMLCVSRATSDVLELDI